MAFILIYIILNLRKWKKAIRGHLQKTGWHEKCQKSPKLRWDLTFEFKFDTIVAQEYPFNANKGGNFLWRKYSKNVWKHLLT